MVQCEIDEVSCAQLGGSGFKPQFAPDLAVYPPGKLLKLSGLFLGLKSTLEASVGEADRKALGT